MLDIRNAGNPADLPTFAKTVHGRTIPKISITAGNSLNEDLPQRTCTCRMYPDIGALEAWVDNIRHRSRYATWMLDES